jgi:hypothetical protein
MPNESMKQALARLSLCHEAVHPQLVASQGLHDLVVTAAAAEQQQQQQQQLQQTKMVTCTCGGIAAPCKRSAHSWSPPRNWLTLAQHLSAETTCWSQLQPSLLVAKYVKQTDAHPPKHHSLPATNYIRTATTKIVVQDRANWRVLGRYHLQAHHRYCQ